MQKGNTKKIDSRILRSKRDLANALEELLQEKNLDDISIQEITERAMVSKNTFYNNFLDKNELVMFIFERYAESIFAQAEPILRQKGDKQQRFIRCLEIVVHFFYIQPERFQKMIQNDHSKTMFWNINNFVQNVVSYIFENYRELVGNDLPEKVVALYYSGAISNLIYFAFLEGPKLEEKDTVRYMAKLFTVLN
ncbi:MAG: TetR/AcrR family transcriptional regulator [Bacillota bacterium]|nr:TetR/AcrR family transcriptional regulator [Bacillota bacterium]